MPITVTSAAVAIVFDELTGRIVGVRNLARGLDLVAADVHAPPFRIKLREAEWEESFISFEHQEICGGVRLNWRCARGVTLECDVLARGDDILFVLCVRNAGTGTIDRVEYPIMAGIGHLDDGADEEFVNSHGTGMLFHNPMELFEEDRDNNRRLRYSFYPEGYYGATMQMMAYYARGRGGFLVGTEDPEKALKWLNFYKQGEFLRCTIIHKAPAIAPGASFAPGYAVVLAPLVCGSWTEAADRYKRWAVLQPWAQSAHTCDWLLEKVGICTFGVNARYDRSAWLNQFHRIAGTPVFHVLGSNWADSGQDYFGHMPHERAGWLPARFSEANLATIRRNGDYWAPFEFDLLQGDPPDDCADGTAGATEPVLASRVVQPSHEDEKRTQAAAYFPYMCAGTDYMHELHVWRDRTLASNHRCDAIYYDVSVANLWLECLSDSHNHAYGAAGTPLSNFYSAMYQDTKEAMSQALGAYVPSGVEVISECFLREFDYYQARAQATPLGPMEVDCYRDWIVAGKAEKIPLFTYVFHERGPLRMDGWGKLAREAGDLFYWTAARVVLSGGLFQLNYEFSGLEDLDGLRDDPAEHYFRFDPRRYSIDPAKAAFVAEVARTRVGPANPYLAHGTMLPSPIVEAPDVRLDYFFYNGHQWFPTYEERGEMTVPSVLVSAWAYQGRSVWLVANLVPHQQTVRVDGKELTLQPRRIALVEL